LTFSMSGNNARRASLAVIATMTPCLYRKRYHRLAVAFGPSDH
jgi:hypothetical protein